MKTDSVVVFFVILLQDALISCVDSLAYMFQSFSQNKRTPSYLAYNVVWFTNCSWIGQLQAFKQLERYLDYGKRHL